MTKILVVVGSARPGRVADKITEYIQKDITTRQDVTAEIIDLKELNLPFFDNEQAPASPEYTITNSQVAAWSKAVTDADSVLFVTPEYNHTLSAIQKNALDSLGKEWVEKPVSAVAYGWTGGSLAVETLREVLTHLKTDLKESISQLGFMKELNPDGTQLDEVAVAAKIKATIDELA